MKSSGSGGFAEEVPRARSGLGGEVGRRVRRCSRGREGCGKMYYILSDEARLLC